MHSGEETNLPDTSLYGDVWLALPMSWQIIGYSISFFVFLILGILSLGSYSRFEIVSGEVKPDVGTVQIIPSRPGTISAVMVREGDKVAASTPLASIQAEEYSRLEGTGPVHVLAALKKQNSELLAQEQSVTAGGEASQRRLAAQILGLKDELQSLDQQINTQNKLVRAAKADLERSQAVASKGFLSSRDLQSREDIVLQRSQQLSSLEQIRVGKQTNLAEAIRTIDEVRENTRAAAANVASERASVTQRVFDVEASRGYVLRAPLGGSVTAITARVGQAAQLNTPVMTIIPEHAKLEAHLYIPTRASGFVEVGQIVKLQIDAFPYTRFGTTPAVIKSISIAALTQNINGHAEPVYVAIATIADPRVYAFNKLYKIQPDMTLKAKIITDKRSLVEWLFEPILATQRR